MTFEKYNADISGESLWFKRKARVLPQELGFSTSGNPTRILSLWAGAKDTKTAKITVGLGPHHEDINLVMGHANVLFREQVVQGLRARLLNRFQATQIGDPYSHIDVLTLMINGNARSAELAESRYFLLQGADNRAK